MALKQTFKISGESEVICVGAVALNFFTSGRAKTALPRQGGKGY